MAAVELQEAVTDLRIDVLGLDATELEMCRRQFGPLGPTGDPLPPWVAAEAFDLRRRGQTLLEIAFRFDLGGELAADRAVRQGAIDRLAPLAEIYRPAAVEQLEGPLPELFAELNRPPPQAIRAAWQITAILRRHTVLVGLFPSPPPKRRPAP